MANRIAEIEARLQAAPDPIFLPRHAVEPAEEELVCNATADLRHLLDELAKTRGDLDEEAAAIERGEHRRRP